MEFFWSHRLKSLNRHANNLGEIKMTATFATDVNLVKSGLLDLSSVHTAPENDA